VKVYSDLVSSHDSSADNQSVLAVLEMTAAFDTFVAARTIIPN